MKKSSKCPWFRGILAGLTVSKVLQYSLLF
jgi:hypothetical protein